MNSYKEDLKKIYRKTANLNLYASLCHTKKERLQKELMIIKNDIENLIKNLEHNVIS